ncbi:hypothetical protein [Paracholeplasma manati]|uniref:Uncharacterized protein n=1 Tax=Paracholeplasma manati TaxID=591373 RepID=A0ABT2Y3L9_9MOLU|nr:hypothetical protein [Paracholeplasma manati]MCV2231327.1 hypothetical protein [Paracholeplasma manati]MDG0888407.1 hypothetical protein [Paracholeplasma manati]
MMKKLLALLVVLFGLVALVGCAGGGTTTNQANDVIDTLEEDGYVLETRDEDSREYYQANMVNTKYGLDVDVTELYVGYVNGNERWVEIVVLKNSTQATEFYDELMLEATSGRFVVKLESVVIITFSEATANLFTSKS